MIELNEIVTLGGGCFWCLDAIFRDVKGVIKVESGYSGGTVQNPTYEAVCSGKSGHVEVVQVTYKSHIISFKEILEIFFSIHDPTQLNRQGNDIGSQYRSVIFYHSSEQEEIALQVIRDLEDLNIWKKPIVTQITPLKDFYQAENYHQDFFTKNPSQRYCQLIIAPKVIEFRVNFKNKLV